MNNAINVIWESWFLSGHVKYLVYSSRWVSRGKFLRFALQLYEQLLKCTFIRHCDLPSCQATSHLRPHFKAHLHYAKANFFFDLCRCSMWLWTLNLTLYEPIWRRCHFRFCFRTNINEPFVNLVLHEILKFYCTPTEFGYWYIYILQSEGYR